jgi:hypothetical protein
MKSIKMMSKLEILISDEELEKIRQLISNGKSGLIGLKNGDIINTNSIETISEAETEPYFMGNRMSKDMTRVFVQGDWKLFAGNKNEIEYKLKGNVVNLDEETRLKRSYSAYGVDSFSGEETKKIENV